MARNSSLPAGKHGGHELGTQRWRGVPDGVDAAVDRAQAPISEPALDPIRVDTRVGKLVSPHAPVLPRGDPSDRVEQRAHIAQ